MIDSVELAARFNRVLLVLFAVHVAMFFFMGSWNALLMNLGASLFVFVGMLAAARQRACALGLWGALMGLYVLFLSFVALAGLPHFVRFTIGAVRNSDQLFLVIGSMCLASLFLMIYYSVCLSSVILAFRLRCAIACNKACNAEYQAVEMGECEAAAPVAEDTTQFFGVPAVGAPVPYAVPAEFANLSNQPMYVMVPLTAVIQQ